MKDYFALLTKPRKFEKPLKTEPSKPSKGASEGNDGLVDKGFQNFVSTKPYISAGDLVTPSDSDQALLRNHKPNSLNLIAEMICKHCGTQMQPIEAGYFSCPGCHYQLVEPRSGFWHKNGVQLPLVNYLMGVTTTDAPNNLAFPLLVKAKIGRTWGGCK